MCRVVNASEDEYVPLQDGACPECMSELIRHEHHPIGVLRFMIDGWNLSPIPRPSERWFGRCPKGHGCWRREGDVVWNLFLVCCTNLRTESGEVTPGEAMRIMEARSDVFIKPQP